MRNFSHHCDVKIGAVVLARMDSQRLPGKALLQLINRPVIKWCCDAIARIIPRERLIIATTDRAIDDVLDDFASVEGYPCIRGQVDDVAGRVHKCLSSVDMDYFVRVNGDSPLINIPLLNQGIGLTRSGNNQLITNLKQRTYPYGLSVEILSSSHFRHVYKHFTEFEKEHITRYYYNHSDISMAELPNLKMDFSGYRFTVDTEEDLQRIESFLRHVQPKDANAMEVRQLVKLYDSFMKIKIP